MNNTIESVIKDGLCTGCGTCVSLCPQNALEMVIDNHKGVYVPQLEREICKECGICFEVCPGHFIDFNGLNTEIFGKTPDDLILGNYIKCYIGHATDYDIRFNSTSGGLATTLLIFALEQGLIDGALVTKMSGEKHLEPQTFIARTRAEIISAAKSKYCPVPANIALKEILKKDGKFAVVGLPCHIHGIRKAETVNKELKERVTLHIGLFCSATMTFKGTDFIKHEYEFLKDDVVHLDYRGKGWPGYMRIQFKDGTEKLIARHEYGIFHSLGFFTPPRCALCFEQTNELADISLGDAWLPELEGDKIGTSLIICRSTKGENILRQAADKGKIVLVDIEGKKVSFLETKKVTFRLKCHLARLSGKKQPIYKTQLPKVGSAPISFLIYNYTLALLLYLNMPLASRSQLERFIKPLAGFEQSIIKLGRFFLNIF